MAKTDNLNDFLTDLADGIRAKKGTIEPINAQNMRAEIESIDGGSGVIEVDELPIPSVENVDKIYFNASNNQYYKCRYGSRFDVGDVLGNSIIFDTSKKPIFPSPDSNGDMNPAVYFGSDSFIVIGACTLVEEEKYMSIVMAQSDAVNILYVDSDDYTIEEASTFLTQSLGSEVSLSEFGWQGNGIIDTSAYAEETISTNVDLNGLIFKPDSYSYVGAIEPLTITKNGIYGNLITTETATVNQDTVFDFEIIEDDVTLSLKKFNNFKMFNDVSELNDESYLSYAGFFLGDETIPLLSLSFTCDSTMCRPTTSPESHFVVWVKDSSVANEAYGVDYFEDNSLYLSNAIGVINEYAGMGDKPWSLTISAPSTIELSGVMPIEVNVPSNVQENIVITKNGTYTPDSGYDGFASVTVDHEDLYKWIEGTENRDVILPSEYLNIKHVEDFDSSILQGVVIRPYAFAGSNINKVDISQYDGHDNNQSIVFEKYCFVDSTVSQIVMKQTVDPMDRGTVARQLSIKEGAFHNCTNLTKFVYTGGGSIYIYKDAFRGCTALETVIIPACYPDEDYRITDAEGNTAFLYETFKDCTNLKNVIFIGSAGGVTQYNAFPDNTDLKIYFTHQTSYNMYKNTMWKELSDKIYYISDISEFLTEE